MDQLQKQQSQIQLRTNLNYKIPIIWILRLLDPGWDHYEYKNKHLFLI